MPTKNETWWVYGWRPALAYIYGVILLFDYVLAPIGMVIYAGITHTPVQQWHPLTAEGNSLVPLSLGSIITASAWTRGQEKIQASKTESTQLSTLVENNNGKA